MELDQAAPTQPLPERLAAAIEAGPAAIRALAEDTAAPDLADALGSLSVSLAVQAVSALPFEVAVDTFDEHGFSSRAEVLTALDLELATALIEAMSPDERADLFDQLSSEFVEVLRPRLSREVSQNLSMMLTYPPESAGRIMTTEFISLRPSFHVSDALDHVRAVARDMETIYYTYLVDPASGVLEGVVSARELIIASPSTPLREVIFTDPKIVRADTDQEEVARLLARYNLLAVPVVNAKGQILGIVTVDDALDTMIEEHSEDLQKVGGMSALEAPYLKTPFFEMVQKRVGWLAILLLGGMLTTYAMGHFAGEIEKATILTLFLPMIISSGGNSGSQATTLIIRAMSTGELNFQSWWRVAWRELRLGLCLGLCLAVLGLLRILGWEWIFGDYGQHYFLIGYTVAASLVGVVVLGTLLGSMLPFLLRRLGFDPASASAPFVATLLDVSGLVIYFSFAKLFLSGSLL